MSRVEWPAVPAVSRWLAEVQANMHPDSRIQKVVRDDIRKIAWEDHERKMLTGITRYGGLRAPLSPRTLANKKRGPGPSLVPRGRYSRYITQLLIQWERIGSSANYEMIIRFNWFTSKSGFPIPLAHEHGVPRKNLPARPVMGITARGMREIAERIDRFADKLVGRK